MSAGCDDCCAAPTSGEIDKPFRRALWIALVLNGVMFAVELYSSFLGRSVALQADAMDFLADAANYSISLFVLGMSLRAKAMAAFIKAGTMSLFGLWVLGMALYRVLQGGAPEPFIMGPVALLALTVNVGVAFLLFAHREGDANRQSIWLCSRNDAIANLAVFAAAGLVWTTGQGWPDILVAVLIAALGLSSAWRVIRQAKGEWREGASPAPHPSV
ncbi:cation transporter [Tepidicaulis sp.]|uniref:cation transporter n=1 Tax=Tepidicaulis sp. TaxID=1920809 RepID=UPI003B5CF83F